MSKQISTDMVKKIPYGISNYSWLRRENFYYVDKTPYLKSIEESGTYLFFIRPRRFGKSLFLTMMEAYYDVLRKGEFEELFKGTWVYDNPTREQGRYLVLSYDFSMVNPGIDLFEESFLEYVRGISGDFVKKYHQFFQVGEPESALKAIEKAKSASDILSVLVRLCTNSKQELYVIIDEYDNFANTILSTSGKGAYEKLTRGTGSFRAFFNILKGGTKGPFSRLFLTGVSPVTLDDVTSGYNIGHNATMNSSLNCMLGFTKKDVVEMIEYYRSFDMVPGSNEFLMNILSPWYGNYQFSRKGDLKMFNSDMVLYFLQNYLEEKELPDNLIDRNVRIDYGKLRHLIIIDKGSGVRTSNGNFNRLKEVIEKGRISAVIQDGFSLENVADEYNFISLLFYFGLLTIEGRQLSKYVLTIPNETIRRLFYDYIREAYNETNVFSLSLSTYGNLMERLAADGEWEPLFDYISGLMRESMSLRDLITGEKSIQAFLNVYLGLSSLYIIHIEREMNKGYADILMEPFLALHEGIAYSYLLELKYVKSGASVDDDKVKQLIADAEDQLKNYSADDKFRKKIENTTLIKLVLVFSGHDLIYRAAVD